MKNSTVRCICILTLLVFCGTLIPALAQGRYTRVEPRELIDNPQRYWARAITFRDTLLEYPEGREVKIGDDKYKALKCETIGTCYAHESVVPFIQRLPRGRSYLFSGTVLQTETGFFRKKTVFRIAIKSFQTTVKSLDVLGSDLKTLVQQMPRRTEVDAGLKDVESLLDKAHSSLYSFALERDQEIADLFADDASLDREIIQRLRTTVRSHEQNEGTTSTEMLTHLLWASFSAQNNPDLLSEESSSPPDEPDTEEDTMPEDEQPAAVSAFEAQDAQDQALASDDAKGQPDIPAAAAAEAEQKARQILDDPSDKEKAEPKKRSFFERIFGGKTEEEKARIAAEKKMRAEKKRLEREERRKKKEMEAAERAERRRLARERKIAERAERKRLAQESKSAEEEASEKKDALEKEQRMAEKQLQAAEVSVEQDQAEAEHRKTDSDRLAQEMARRAREVRLELERRTLEQQELMKAKQAEREILARQQDALEDARRRTDDNEQENTLEQQLETVEQKLETPMVHEEMDRPPSEKQASSDDNVPEPAEPFILLDKSKAYDPAEPVLR